MIPNITMTNLLVPIEKYVENNNKQSDPNNEHPENHLIVPMPGLEDSVIIQADNAYINEGKDTRRQRQVASLVKIIREIHLSSKDYFSLIEKEIEKINKGWAWGSKLKTEMSTTLQTERKDFDKNLKESLSQIFLDLDGYEKSERL